MRNGGPVSDQEIDAFLDGELTPERRLQVQQAIAADPDLAMRVMVDMHLAEALRLRQPARQHPAQTVARAERLRRAIARRRWMKPIGRAAMAASLLAVGWVANTLSLPYRTDDRHADLAFALMARETVAVAERDERLQSGPEPIDEKIRRLGHTAEVDLPDLPGDWVVKDVRLEPIDGRRGVVVAADSAAGPVSLVAAQMTGDDDVPPTAVDDPHAPAVFWQEGDTGYTLVGKGVSSGLLRSVAATLTVASRRPGTYARIRG